MKFVKENFAYIILGAIALVLIFVTLSLQARILSTPEPATVAGGPSGTTTGDLPAPIAAGDRLAAENLAEESVTASTSATDAFSAETSLLYNADNVTVSEDDDLLAAFISDNPLAVGFVGYAYYLAHQDRLRTVAIRLPDGQLVEPGAASVTKGLYPLARPLYLYTSPTILREQPAVERFIGCYLNQLPQAVSDVGYLLPSRALFAQAIQSFDAVCQQCQRESTDRHPLATTIPACDLSDRVGGTIVVVGSSTVKPLSTRMAEIFTELGFSGTIEVDGAGTRAGFRAFCEEAQGDLVDASRTVTREERAICNEENRSLIPFPIAVDALAIVVARENTFLQEASLEELQQIFAYAARWSDVNAAWPNDAIIRALPSPESGTVDYFADAVMAGEAIANLAARQANPLSDALFDTIERGSTSSAIVGSGLFANGQSAVRLGYVAGDDRCVENTTLAALMMTRKFGLTVTTIALPTVDELFQRLSAKEISQQVDLTFCYIEPTDRSYRQRYFGYTEFIGSGYQQQAATRYVITSNSAVKISLERTNSCLYQTLTTLNWNGLVLNGQDVATWYETNLPTVDNWIKCN